MRNTKNFQVPRPMPLPRASPQRGNDTTIGEIGFSPRILPRRNARARAKLQLDCCLDEIPHNRDRRYSYLTNRVLLLAGSPPEFTEDSRSRIAKRVSRLRLFPSPLYIRLADSDNRAARDRALTLLLSRQRRVARCDKGIRWNSRGPRKKKNAARGNRRAASTKLARARGNASPRFN